MWRRVRGPAGLLTFHFSVCASARRSARVTMPRIIAALSGCVPAGVTLGDGAAAEVSRPRVSIHT